MSDIDRAKISKMYNMKPFESLDIGYCQTLQRVPGGWIHQECDEEKIVFVNTFIPFNNEFQVFIINKDD